MTGDEQDPHGSHPGADEVGSVGEEAAKLLSALQDWARTAGAEQASAATAAAGGVLGGIREVNEHIATGGQDCKYCPVCQLISHVRELNPEVRSHLSTAASSLLQAAAGLLATEVPQSTGRGRSEQGLQKIDLTDDGQD